MENSDAASISAVHAGRHGSLLASPRHTWILFSIVMLLTGAGVLNTMHGKPAGPAGGSPDPGNMITTGLIMIAMLWGWVFFVYRGMQERGHSPLEFFDFKRLTPRGLAGDCACALLVGAMIYACSQGIHAVLPETRAANPIHSSIPSGLLGIAVWVALSFSAGISEEIVFRGYLQRQMGSITGRVGFAILLQALLFGVGHAYQGVGAVVAIVSHGALLGVLAAWRGNIRAGVIEHAGWDILAGFGEIQATRRQYVKPLRRALPSPLLPASSHRRTGP